MENPNQDISFQSFLSGMIKTGLEASIRYLYENRESIVNTVGTKVEEALTPATGDGEGEDAPTEPRPVPVTVRPVPAESD